MQNEKSPHSKKQPPPNKNKKQSWMEKENINIFFSLSKQNIFRASKTIGLSKQNPPRTPPPKKTKQKQKRKKQLNMKKQF